MRTASTATRIDTARKTLVMGVLNATPDSFYPPSTVASARDARERALQFVQDGADIIDVGGESSRPGSEPVSIDAELNRVLPILEALQGLEAHVSIDTYRAETAREAIARGATMVNDITALRGDADMAGVVAAQNVECILMHMQGTPATMQEAPEYADVIDDIAAFFEERLAYATACGIPEERIWLDPGFGFGKTVDHNLTLLRRLGELKRFGRPLLIGTSNKSTIGTVLGVSAEDRIEGTAATVAVAICHGADAVRVHDVKPMARVATMCDAIMRKGQP